MLRCAIAGIADSWTRLRALPFQSHRILPKDMNETPPRDFANVLRFARGSCAELRTQLYIADEISLIEPTTAKRLQVEALELSKMIQSLINRCKHRFQA
jgi:hypothetical protein